jgi:hypothetical protein
MPIALALLGDSVHAMRVLLGAPKHRYLYRGAFHRVSIVTNPRLP